MATVEDVHTRGRVGEFALGARLLAGGTFTWTMAKLGDPAARLLHTPWRENPYPIYEQLRAAGPLARSRLGLRVATSHELCESILRDSRFGVRTSDGGFGDPTTEAVDLQLSLLELDPPDHTRLRRIAAPAFRPRKLDGYRRRIEEIADELLDQVSAHGGFDLVRDFAAPLPIRVISELLDLPDVGTRFLTEHGSVLSGSLDGIRSPRHLRRMRESTTALEGLFTDLVEQRRRDPGDDVVSDLVAALDEDRLTVAELLQMCNLLLVAGFETTVGLISNAVLAMLDRTSQWHVLCDAPELAGPAVEETLRWDPPVQATLRIAAEPLELAGQPLSTDSVVMALVAAAGRDPAVHSDPARFDITRGTRDEHLAFSSGMHHCLGAPLARMEGEIALRRLATRLPDLRMVGNPTRRPTTILRGLTSLPVSTS
ncbi:cytochrome P450 [Parasphingorhabdus pacifica]